MITSAVSRESQPNPDFYEIKRRRGEDNLGWLKRLLRDYTPQGVVMLLVGGTDALSFRLRVAQAHVRHDMTPSAWSHVALVVDPSPDDVGRSRLVEISLDPHRGFGWAPDRNAVQERVPISRYGDAERFPNIAVVDLPPDVPPADPDSPPATAADAGAAAAAATAAQRKAVTAALQRFMMTRGTLDCCELVVQWLSFVWGAGPVTNPLFAGRGIPSAVLVESLAATTGFDLTPSIDSRSSCPEAVWQAAKWWHGLHDKVATRRLMGAYCITHDLVK
ncbi:MAG: hypothetical protein ACREM3_01080 [Candidatus Rokuibacteriota bacterium]